MSNGLTTVACLPSGGGHLTKLGECEVQSSQRPEPDFLAGCGPWMVATKTMTRDELVEMLKPLQLEIVETPHTPASEGFKKHLRDAVCRRMDQELIELATADPVKVEMVEGYYRDGETQHPHDDKVDAFRETLEQYMATKREMRRGMYYGSHSMLDPGHTHDYERLAEQERRMRDSCPGDHDHAWIQRGTYDHRRS